MPENAKRCPQCWADLPDYVTDTCPYCRRSIGVDQTWRSGGAMPEVMAPAAAAAAAPAGGGVALAERDRQEFPGTPLPPDFFDALPEKVRNPRSRPIPARAIGVLALVAVGVVSGIVRSADRNHDLSSPARSLIAGPCAEYRDFTTRMHNGQDAATAQEGMRWFQANVGTFAEAARLDPALGPASGFVTWFSNAIQANFDPLIGMSKDDIDAREKPLSKACFTGPGRA